MSARRSVMEIFPIGMFALCVACGGSDSEGGASASPTPEQEMEAIATRLASWIDSRGETGITVEHDGTSVDLPRLLGFGFQSPDGEYRVRTWRDEKIPNLSPGDVIVVDRPNCTVDDIEITFAALTEMTPQHLPSDLRLVESESNPVRIRLGEGLRDGILVVRCRSGHDAFRARPVTGVALVGDVSAEEFNVRATEQINAMMSPVNRFVRDATSRAVDLEMERMEHEMIERVSQVRGDLRSLATALEQYYIDHGMYPNNQPPPPAANQ